MRRDANMRATAYSGPRHAAAWAGYTALLCENRLSTQSTVITWQRGQADWRVKTQEELVAFAFEKHL